MQKVAIFFSDGPVFRQMQIHLDRLAGEVRERGLPLHFYLIAGDESVLKSCRNISVEFIRPSIVLGGWHQARVLQRLLVNYDVACFVGLFPASAFLMQAWPVKVFEWSAGWHQSSKNFSLSSLVAWRKAIILGVDDVAFLYSESLQLVGGKEGPSSQ